MHLLASGLLSISKIWSLTDQLAFFFTDSKGNYTILPATLFLFLPGCSCPFTNGLIGWSSKISRRHHNKAIARRHRYRYRSARHIAAKVTFSRSHRIDVVFVVAVRLGPDVRALVQRFSVALSGRSILSVRGGSTFNFLLMHCIQIDLDFLDGDRSSKVVVNILAISLVWWTSFSVALIKRAHAVQKSKRHLNSA